MSSSDPKPTTNTAASASAVRMRPGVRELKKPRPNSIAVSGMSQSMHEKRLSPMVTTPTSAAPRTLGGRLGESKRASWTLSLCLCPAGSQQQQQEEQKAINLV